MAGCLTGWLAGGLVAGLAENTRGRALVLPFYCSQLIRLIRLKATGQSGAEYGWAR